MISLEIVKNAKSIIKATEPGNEATAISLTREWDGNICKSKLINTGDTPIRLNQVVLFSIPHNLPGETKIYGEGFQMLSQTEGTIDNPISLTCYSDRDHYKIPMPSDAISVYGLLTVLPPGHQTSLFAFTSCCRFAGRFDIRPDRIDVVLETENLEVSAGEVWYLEEFMFASGDNKNKLLSALADQIQENHPRLEFEDIPTGWCSWYTYGPDVTVDNIVENTDFILQKDIDLKYIQIDDGYQAAMGDWLNPEGRFSNLQEVLDDINRKDLKTGIWIAPFIAEEGSKVFQEHKDWFVKDDHGNPLRSDTVSFGGWRRGPWYVLDATHPEVQMHIDNFVRTMHVKWGCDYFKMDANFWGAIHGGHFFNPKATRIQAYRSGMHCIIRGSDGAFLLGCNQPMWASFGLVHGVRTSNDITREWDTFKSTARENLLRGWQNGKLWWNDPDCLLLTGKLPDEEYRFHSTVVYAVGGLVLSGDALPSLSSDRLDMLKKLIPPTGIAAEFDDSFEVGFVRQPEQVSICFLNWEDEPKTLSVDPGGQYAITELWSGDTIASNGGVIEIEMPPHSGKILICK